MGKLTLLIVLVILTANPVQGNTPQNLGHILPEVPAAQSTTPQELTLSSEQSKLLQRDGPLTALCLDQDYALWMGGQKHIWIWRFDDQSLQKIEMIRGEQNPLGIQQISIYNKRAYARTSSGLFQIELNPLKIVQHKLTKPQEISLKTQIINNQIHWINSKGIYKILPQTHSQKPLASLRINPQGVDWVYVPSENTLWTLTNKSLYLQKITSQDRTLLIEFGDQEQPKNLTLQSNQIFLVTSKSLYRFDTKGLPLEKIPANSSTTIIASYLDLGHHNFLLNNGTWELHSLGSKQSAFFRGLPLLEKTVTLSNMSEKAVGVLLDGEPRVFQMNTGISL